jgi:hypothetical protein
MVERAGLTAKLGIKVHALMLRHACGFALANQGHDTRAPQAYIGHANIQNTTRYTALAEGPVQRVLAGLTQASPGGTVGKPKGLSRKRWFAAKRQAPGVRSEPERLSPE